MGMTKCSAFCDRDDRRPGCQKLASPPCYDAYQSPPDMYVDSGLPFEGDLGSLMYTPPPLRDIARCGASMIGTPIPERPKANRVYGLPLTGMINSTDRDLMTRKYSSCGRPGEPVNQVFVQFSNDLEGFLPYTLVISADEGLEFNSLSQSPDFKLNPLNIMKADRVRYDTLMNDAFFSSHAKSVQAALGHRVEAVSGSSCSTAAATQLDIERVQPPYTSVVQLNVKRTMLEGGQVLIFLAVQSEPLAEELIRSCVQLKRHKSTRITTEMKMSQHYMPRQQQQQAQDPGSPSRGCLSPRSLGTRTPGAIMSLPCINSVVQSPRAAQAGRD